MSSDTLLSIIESPTHPNFSGVYRKLGFNEVRVESLRKAINQLKKLPPDYVVAEFFYGYGNNYAGVNISNLDVFLSSLPKYAPDAKVILLVAQKELQFVDKLKQLFPVYAVLAHPINEKMIKELFITS